MAKILIAGDFCPYGRVKDMIENQDFSFFNHIRKYTSSADYSIINFECAVEEGVGEKINKCGPNLKTSRKAIDAIKYAGFNCATLANNHIRDYGDKGCINAINSLINANIEYVGAGKNVNEAKRVHYIEVNEKVIAIINFCENEFSVATENRAGAMPMDSIDNYNQIIEARKNADTVIVITHGGHEHYQLPSPRMKKLYRHYISLGADAVINHHQHCYAGYEYYQNKPIIYGLGNFCFDRNDINLTSWFEGYCIYLFTDSLQIELLPYIQCKDNAEIVFMTGEKLSDFNTSIQALNSIIENDELLKTEYNLFSKKRESTIKAIFASYHNRYLNAAANRNIIPRPILKKEFTQLYNYIKCEAHREATLLVFENILNEFEDERKD